MEALGGRSDTEDTDRRRISCVQERPKVYEELHCSELVPSCLVVLEWDQLYITPVFVVFPPWK